jgi:hypothetical protein
LIHFRGGRVPLLTTLPAILGTSPECGAVWRVWRSLRTRMRRAEWWVGGPRARVRDVQRRTRQDPRALGCLGLSAFHADMRSAWVQQHCGVGSCTTVASRCGGVCPLLLYRCWFTSEGSMPARVRWLVDRRLLLRRVSCVRLC